MPSRIPLSPLLDADPATLPPWRKGDRKVWGGFFKYVRALNPGPPPFGWKDITPYFGRKFVAIGKYRIIAEEEGYLLTRQVVTINGQTYRRIAVALKSHHPLMEKNK